MKTFTKILLLTTFCILYSLFCLHAQNLVPNPSFEDTVACPDISSNIEYSDGWHSYNGTPDYFNICSSSNNYSIPNNGWGNQDAANCYEYAGFWAYYYPFSPNGREYIGRQMSSNLTIGQKYYLSVKVSLAEISNCGTNKIGLLFSTVSYSQSNPILVNNTPHFFTTAIITDTLDWTIISGSFIADSSYQYIIIGNFFDDSNTDTIKIAPIQFYGYGAYFYLDDVCVSTDSTVCNPFIPTCNTDIKEINVNEPITIYPNPFSNRIIIDINDNVNNIKLTDVLGKSYPITIIESNKQLEIKPNSNLPDGIYILNISTYKHKYTNKLIHFSN